METPDLQEPPDPEADVQRRLVPRHTKAWEIFTKMLLLGMFGFSTLGDNVLIKETAAGAVCQGLVAMFVGAWMLSALRDLPPMSMINAVFRAWPVLIFFGYALYVQLFLVKMEWPDGYIDLGQVILWFIMALIMMTFVPFELMRRPELMRFFLSTIFWLSVVLSLTAVWGFCKLPGAATILSQNPAYTLGPFIANGGMLEHPITLSLQAMTGMVLGMRILRRNWNNIPILFGMGCLVMGLFASMSRSGMVGLLCAGPLLMISPRRLRNPFIVAGVFMCIAAAALGLYVAATRIDWLGNLLRLDKGLSNRDVRWGFSIQMVRDQPLGNGFDAAARALHDFFQNSPDERVRDMAVVGNHSTFMDAAVNQGLPGLGLYYVMFFIACWRGIRSGPLPRLDLLSVALAIGYFVAIHFITVNVGGLRLTAICMTVFVGIAMQSPRFVQSKKKPKKRPVGPRLLGAPRDFIPAI